MSSCDTSPPLNSLELKLGIAYMQRKVSAGVSWMYHVMHINYHTTTKSECRADTAPKGQISVRQSIIELVEQAGAA